MFKLKIIILKFVNKILNIFNLSLDLSIKKNKIIETLRQLKPYDLGFDLIRIGPLNDGGYLIPNILNQIQYCFSPGVGNKTGFEKGLIEKEIKIFLLDGTIDEENIKLKNFNFIKKNLASYSSEKTITLENWVKNCINNNSSLLLQMDIESSEYEVIHSTSQECFKMFKILVIEFHYIEKMNNYFFYENFTSAIKKILLNFEVAHIHPNNCGGLYPVSGINLPTALEVTFLRRDLCKYKKDISELPHKLDQKNIQNLPNITFPKNIIIN